MDSSEQMRAYVRAQEANAFRRLLWRRLAIMTLTWLIAAWAMSLSRAATLVGVAMLAVPALWALSYERRLIGSFYRH
jgi:hypothetical protein